MRILLALHALAIALTFLAAPPKWIALGIAALILISWFSLRRHPAFGYGPRAVVRVIAHAGGGWTLERANGARGKFERIPGGPVEVKLTVIRFVPVPDAATGSGRRQPLRAGVCTRVLLGDEAPAERLRLLRARLLLGEARSTAADRPDSSSGS